MTASRSTKLFPSEKKYEKIAFVVSINSKWAFEIHWTASPAGELNAPIYGNKRLPSNVKWYEQNAKENEPEKIYEKRIMKFSYGFFWPFRRNDFRQQNDDAS